MLCSIKLRQNINIHGLPETAGYINTSYADPCIGLKDEQKVRYNKTLSDQWHSYVIYIQEIGVVYISHLTLAKTKIHNTVKESELTTSLWVYFSHL